MKRPPEIDWRHDDLSRRGHGVEICYQGDGGVLVLAFIEGFEWSRGAPRVEVRVLRDEASEWALLGTEAAAIRQQVRELVHEILAGAPLTLKRGRFQVWANA